MSKVSKAYKNKVAVRRTMQDLKKFIDSGSRLKESYIEKAKQARIKGAYSSYQLARSGLKAVMMQIAKAEEMLMNIELINQYADFEKLSDGFVKGMNSVSKELGGTAAKMNFEKAEKLFNKALQKADFANDRLGGFLENTGDGFASAASMSDIVDTEIDKLIGSEVIGSEDKEFEDKMNALRGVPAAQPAKVERQAAETYQAAPQSAQRPAPPPAYVPPPPQGQAFPAAGTPARPASVELEGDTLRPKKLADFRGQPEVVRQLQIWMDSAKKDNQPLEHVLLTGWRGLGKSTVAEIIACEMGGTLIEVQGDTIKNKDIANGIFSKIKKGDILYVDEVHLMPPDVQDTFLKAIDENKYFVTSGRKPFVKTEVKHIPKFTFIGATTDKAGVKPTLQDRCVVKLKLELYPADVLADIIVDMLRKLGGLTISYEDALDLGRRCRGVPRLARNHCKMLRAIATYKNKKAIDAEILKEYVFEGVDELGLEKSDLDYLDTLINKFNGGPVGIEVLSNALRDQKKNVIKEVEPYLCFLGLINVAGGRVAMPAAYKHLGLIKEESPAVNNPPDNAVNNAPVSGGATNDAVNNGAGEIEDEDGDGGEQSASGTVNPAERAAAEALAGLGGGYTVYNDIMLRSPDQRTFQIDHMAVSRFGIFVIETKNYTGKIEGYRNAELYKQTKGANVKYIYNPVLQNTGHIRALMETVGNYPYYSLAAFSDFAELDIKDTPQVCRVCELCGRILSYTDAVLTDADVAKVNAAVKAAVLTGEQFRAEHNAAVKAARERRRKR